MEDANLDLGTFDPIFTLPAYQPETESPLGTEDDTDEHHLSVTNLPAQVQP
jgi:hypothetical protein